MLLESVKGGCPADWTSVAGGCYQFLPEKLSWNDAKEACEDLPGWMVEIESEEQNDALHDEAVKRKFVGLWIGLSDKAKEGEWVRNSAPGEKASFTLWNSDSPSNSKHKDKEGENCAALITTLNTLAGKKPQSWNIPKQWNDKSCKVGTLPVVCQHKISLTKAAVDGLVCGPGRAVHK